MPARRFPALGSIALGTIVLAGWTACSSPAAAQFAGSLSLDSDYRFRGLSLSNGRPALSLNLAYDHSSGAYIGASATAEETPHTGVQFLGHSEYLGFAVRASHDLSLDVGVSHSWYAQYYDREYDVSYTEIYAGVSKGPISVRLYYSPDYFGSGTKTLYAEVNGAVSPWTDWRLFSHVGALTYLTQQPWDHQPERYDLRVGIAREFKGAEIRAAFTTATRLEPPPGVKGPSQNAVVLGGTLYF
jgi:uncharacterized protein (TIGR02001 family)